MPPQHDEALRAHLPADLAARAIGAEAAPAAGGRHVLLWIRAAMRARSNPALEAAIALARGLGLPLLAYQALDERHPHASDRLWRFALEGARDLAAGLEERGVRYALHVTRPGHRTPALSDLARESAAVVCDIHPVEPIRTWTERLASGSPAPIVEVDAACVVPVTESRSAPTRAFSFRKKTAAARAEWLGWEPAEQPAPAPFDGPLPFEPVDLDGDLDALVAECEIDHGVAPVAHTRGGSAAGEARWAEFQGARLGSYARDRNDPLRRGVSRMSPYFHFGMVSPLRVAAEAARIGGKGADKYLDELLVWRELAWHFCHHTRDIDSLESVPGWARATLAEHAGDERDALHSWDRLAHARTGDRLWDAMQRSLLRHGELHNNLRMTWGKALLQWIASPDEALRVALDLNHRYALDGRDPASYGGILWCFGQFDREFPPARPVTGTLRERTTDVHASRIDVDAYEARTRRVASGEPRSIAVIGAGIAGLSAARALADAGHDVVVFDKARGVGGRTSLRRGARVQFDHGAQYFTARDPRFRRFVDAWAQEGVVAPFEARLGVVDADGRLAPGGEGDTTRYVGVPGMNAMAKRMAEGLEVVVGARVTDLARDHGAWTLSMEDGRRAGGFDLVLVTAPAPQAAALVADHSEPLARVARGVRMDPCWAAMVGFAEPVEAPFDGLFVNSGPLSWACRNAAKPGRDGGDAWVLHATPEWTRAHLEAGREEVTLHLTEALREALGVASLPLVAESDAHRWMYSLAAPALEDDALLDAAVGLGLAGDWLAGSKVQGAWLSGRALAGRALAALGSARASETVPGPW